MSSWPRGSASGSGFMPQVEIIEVSSWLVAHSPALLIELGESRIPCSSGLQLASRYAADPEHDYIYRNVTSLSSFEPMLSRIEHADYTDLWRCAAEIPQEWYQYDAQALFRLVSTLYKRRSIIRSLITALRRFMPNLFPKWTR